MRRSLDAASHARWDARTVVPTPPLAPAKATTRPPRCVGRPDVWLSVIAERTVEFHSTIATRTWSRSSSPKGCVRTPRAPASSADG